MVRLLVTDETPLGVVAVQAHQIAADSPCDRWVGEAIEYFAQKIESGGNRVTSVSSQVYKKVFDALEELEDSVVCREKRYTVTKFRELLETARENGGLIS